jgi:hypothetical protein
VDTKREPRRRAESGEEVKLQLTLDEAFFTLKKAIDRTFLNPVQCHRYPGRCRNLMNAR